MVVQIVFKRHSSQHDKHCFESCVLFSTCFYYYTTCLCSCFSPVPTIAQSIIRYLSVFACSVVPYYTLVVVQSRSMCSGSLLNYIYLCFDLNHGFSFDSWIHPDKGITASKLTHLHPASYCILQQTTFCLKHRKDMQWTGVQSRVNSCLMPRVPRIGD